VKDLGMKIRSATDNMQSGSPGCALRVAGAVEGRIKQQAKYEIEDEETALSKVARDRRVAVSDAHSHADGQRPHRY
jgi:hypothetical protein